MLAFNKRINFLPSIIDKFMEINSKKRASYTLVSVTEAKPLEGRISDLSPMGKALYNRVKGDEFELDIAQGKSKFRILKVN